MIFPFCLGHKHPFAKILIHIAIRKQICALARYFSVVVVDPNIDSARAVLINLGSQSFPTRFVHKQGFGPDSWPSKSWEHDFPSLLEFLDKTESFPFLDFLSSSCSFQFRKRRKYNDDQYQWSIHITSSSFGFSKQSCSLAKSERT